MFIKRYLAHLTGKYDANTTKLVEIEFCKAYKDVRMVMVKNDLENEELFEAVKRMALVGCKIDELRQDCGHDIAVMYQLLEELAQDPKGRKLLDKAMKKLKL